MIRLPYLPRWRATVAAVLGGGFVQGGVSYLFFKPWYRLLATGKNAARRSGICSDGHDFKWEYLANPCVTISLPHVGIIRPTSSAWSRFIAARPHDRLHVVPSLIL